MKIYLTIDFSKRLDTPFSTRDTSLFCLSATTPPSDWMKAEFGVGLEAANKWGYTRVLVARLEEGANVPEELKNCPAYNAWGNGAAALAELVRAGNKFDFMPTEIQDAVWSEFFEEPFKCSRLEGPRAKPSAIELLLGLPWRIDDLGPSEFSQSMMHLRSLVDQIDRCELDSVPGLGSMLLEACFGPALPKNHHEIRENAIGTIARLAELGNKDAVPRLILLLAGEQHAGVISMAFSWMRRYLHELEGNALAIALLSIAKAPNEAAGLEESFIRSLPEALQCRLRTGRDLDPHALSARERLAQAARRIDVLLTEQLSNVNYANFQVEFSRVREAALSFYEGKPHPKAATPELISPAFDVIEKILDSSERREGYPLSTIELAFDRLLTPLAMCCADRQHPERASKLFDQACKIMSASGKTSENKLAAYRTLLIDLERGATFDEAYARIKETLHKAYRLDEETEREKKFRKWQAEGLFK